MKIVGIAALVGLVACSSPGESVEPTWTPIGGVTAPAYQLLFPPDAPPILVTLRFEIFEIVDQQLVPSELSPPNRSDGGWLSPAPDGSLWWTERVSGQTWWLQRPAAVWEPVAPDPQAIACAAIRSAKNGTRYTACRYPDLDGLPEERYAFQRPGEGWNRGRRVVEGTAETSQLRDDPSSEGMLVGDDTNVHTRIVDSDAAALLPFSVTRAFGPVSAVTPAGHFIIGDSNYGPGELWELRPDGFGRSWVDQGCSTESLGLAGYCINGQLDLVFGSPPALAPTGVVYAVRRVQNGDSGGVLLRARPSGTQWEYVADGNPIGAEFVTVKVSPDHQLYLISDSPAALHVLDGDTL